MKTILKYLVMLGISFLPCLGEVVLSNLGGRRIVFSVNDEEYILPIGLTEVEFLRNDGKTQYIDTGIIGGEGLKVQMKIMPLESVNDKWAMGSYDVDARIYVVYQCGIYSVIGKWGGGYGGYFNGSTNIKPNVRTTFISVFSESEQILVDDNIEVGRFQKSSSYNPRNLSHTIYLFGLNYQNNLTGPFLCEIGRTIIWINDEKVRDLIPVRFVNDKEENEGVMYDVINNELFTNKGVGYFTIGPDL